MKISFNNIIRKAISIVLTQESGYTLNASLYKFKNKYKRIFRLINGTATDDEIFNNVVKKLDAQFDILMVHSSLNDMVPMYTGSLNKLLSLILSYCKQNNITLAMPAFFSGSNREAKEYMKMKSIFSMLGKLFLKWGCYRNYFEDTKC